jgi:hypothetical protein
VRPYPTADAFIKGKDFREYCAAVHGGDARYAVDTFELAEAICTEESVTPPSSFVEHVDDGTVVFANRWDVGHCREIEGDAEVMEVMPEDLHPTVCCKMTEVLEVIGEDITLETCLHL